MRVPQLFNYISKCVIRLNMYIYIAYKIDNGNHANDKVHGSEIINCKKQLMIWNLFYKQTNLILFAGDSKEIFYFPLITSETNDSPTKYIKTWELCRNTATHAFFYNPLFWNECVRIWINAEILIPKKKLLLYQIN